MLEVSWPHVGTNRHTLTPLLCSANSPWVVFGAEEVRQLSMSSGGPGSLEYNQGEQSPWLSLLLDTKISPSFCFII